MTHRPGTTSKIMSIPIRRDRRPGALRHGTRTLRMETDPGTIEPIPIQTKAVQRIALTSIDVVQQVFRIWNQRRTRCDFAEPILLLLTRSVMRQFVPDDGARVRNEGANDILLQPQREVEVAPRFVSVL